MNGRTLQFELALNKILLEELHKGIDRQKQKIHQLEQETDHLTDDESGDYVEGVDDGR